MKCFLAIVLLALFAVAFAAQTPAEPEQVHAPLNPEAEGPARDKRGVLLGYNAHLAYSYGTPYAYNVPYAYRSYPFSYSYYW